MTTQNSAVTTDNGFSQVFFKTLLRVLTDAGSSPWQIADSSDVDGDPDRAEPVRICLVLEGALRGEFLLEIDSTGAALLASKFLQTPVDELQAEHIGALERLVTSASRAFRSEVGPEYGSFTLTATSTQEPPRDSTNAIQLSASEDDGNSVSVVVYLDSELTQCLEAHRQAKSASADIGMLMKAAGVDGIAGQVNLELVMDVELSVTLRFGKRQLTLREVLELTSGSVVELDRQVEEPVELLLDGIVIARGEAVVVDGNYGLRVTEVSQPLSPVIN